MVSRPYAVFEIEGSERPLQFKNYWNRAVQNMGQLCCHTKLPSASRLSRINARCNRTGIRGSNALLEQTHGRFVVLAGNLVREEDRPS
jgi:hypothetical protein